MIDDKIQKAMKPILSIYSKLELDLIEKIASHFNINDKFINSDYWYFEKLKEMGGLNNETLKMLEELTGISKKELLSMLKEIGFSSIPMDQLNIAGQKGMLDPILIKNSPIIQNIIQNSYDTLYNEFVAINKTINESVRKVYVDIITKAYIETSSGVKSYQQSILESLDNLAEKGITGVTIEDKNGKIKTYDVVGTVRRDLLLSTRGLAGKVNEEVIKESGNHIVRVSNHFGARTGDGTHNYTNHAWWQTLQYFCWNYDGKATEEEKKLPKFEILNYGDVRGICGINCKHMFTTWFGSLEKDKLDFNYDENKQQYENTQYQRYLERGIVKWKRKQKVAKGCGDTDGYKKATDKVKEWQNRIIEFTENNNLKRDYTREHIK